MKKATVIPLLVFILLAGLRPLEAQGFRNFELGIRAATLGGAFVARADDASAVFYNPAGLAFLPGFRFKTNLNYLKPTTRADIPGYDRRDKSDPTQFRGSHYLALNVGGRVTFGIGRFAPDTMETIWTLNWPGRTHSILSRLNSGCFRTAAGLKISKNLAVGAGVDFVSATQNWDYEKIFTFEETSPGLIFPSVNKTEVSGRGVGFTAGLLFKLGDRFGLGGKYTSKVRIDLAGSTILENLYAQGFVPGLATDAAMTMPQEIVVGVVYSPLKSLTFHLDFQRTGMLDAVDWVFHIDPKVYDDLEEIVGFRPDEDVTDIGLELKDASRIMFGIEYALGNSVGVRVGYSRQGSTVKDARLHPVFPDLGGQVFSFGLGYEGPLFDFYDEEEKIGGLSVDVCVQYGSSPGRTSSFLEFPATYRASRWYIGAGVGFVY